MTRNTRSPATQLAQALGWHDPVTGALSPGIQPASTFLRNTAAAAGFTYARDAAPGNDLPQRMLAELEGGARGLLFASGMAAATAVFLAFNINGFFEYNFGDAEIITMIWFCTGVSLAASKAVGGTAQTGM